jgi:hypothetical protein
MSVMTWTLLSIFVIAPLGALAFDRPLFGNWIWRIELESSREYVPPHEYKSGYYAHLQASQPATPQP